MGDFYELRLDGVLRSSLTPTTPFGALFSHFGITDHEELRAVVCYQPPDGKHEWLSYGGAGTFLDGWSTSGWAATGSMWGIPPKKCHKLMLRAPAEGRTAFEVRMLEGEPDCPYNNAEDFEACYEQIGYKTIRGPWRFEFRVPNPAGGDRPKREADD